MRLKLKKGLAVFTSLLTMAGTCISGNFVKPEKAAAAANVTAFPGAVGGGKYATGGRGGEVVHVTNLNDSGEGSFRDAVSKSNRIVVFDVSGTIELKSNILCQSNITIAGQTAPGGSGITLKNYKMGMSGDNIICRYISSRPGPYAATSSGNDAWGGAKGSNSIIDHCSMGWTTDEQWGLYSNNMNYTVQYSVLGPADSWGGHKKGLHGFGLMMGKGNLTFDHNLIIHNVSRNFRGKVQSTYTADFTNNIIYDWGYQTAYGTIGHLNYVNNTLKAGNSTTGGYHWMYVDSGTSPQNFKVYCDGNQLINKDGSLHAISNDNWSGVTVKESIGITKNDLYSAAPFGIDQNGENISSVAGAESAAASYEHVISYAGNGISPDERTAIDRQCAEETKNGTGSCSGTEAYDSSVTDLDKYKIQCGVTYTYPSAVLKKEITDSDNDGMPDEWELARGLNPNDASDTKGDYCGQGYTNIEYYINDLTVDSFPEGVVTPSPETTEVKSISAFELIEAEDYSEQSGVKIEEYDDDIKGIGYIENGDYIMFKNVDFGDGARSVVMQAAGNKAVVEVYLDSLESTPIGKINFTGTGNWQAWMFTLDAITKTTGKHDLYLKFTGGEGYLLNVDSLSFNETGIPLNGNLIKNLIIRDHNNFEGWSIQNNAGKDSLIFGDRAFTFTEFPEELNGAEMIRTACDSKNSTDDLAWFYAGDDISVYIAMDSRVETLPEWLSDWTKTNLVCKSSNDVTFELYKKNFKSEDAVKLGTNGQSAYCVNYSVFAIKDDTPDYGDLNSDGKINSSDIVMLQKYLVKKADLTEQQGKAADFNNDGKLNVFDLVMLKRKVLKNNSSYQV